MTNEEAIKLLNDITSYCDFTDEYGDMIDSTPYYTALGLAIKALEQQPCEDCINRKAIMKYLENITMDTNPDHYDSKDGWYQANGFNACKVGIEMYVKNLPSVTPIISKKETVEDCISREAVLDTEYQIKEINDIEYVMLSEVQMKIRKMPSVTPKAESEE